MITYLLIKNFALIEKSEIRFQPGLNIITGESGAGKSILVNAISQLCGERSRLEWIADGAQKAVIEAHLDLGARPDISAFVKERFEPSADNILIIRKEIAASGTSRIFINDSPVTLNDLNDLSPLLFDLHGQHQHQALLHPENHLRYLDAFAGTQKATAAFADEWRQYKALLQRERELQNSQSQALQQKDLYSFQIGELDKAELREDELEQLKDESRILNNYEKLHQAAQAITELLYSGEPNATELVNRAEDQLQEMARFDPQFAEMLSNMATARDTIEEIGRETERYLGSMEFDPERAEFLRQRIAQLEFLLKKYRQENISGLLQLREDLAAKLDDIENFDRRLEEIRAEKKKHTTRLQEMGEALHSKRREAADRFCARIDEIIHEIGMADGRFVVEFNVDEDAASPFFFKGKNAVPAESGFDRVQFSFSANPGEREKPIHKIASGGELSRLMLALKTILAEKDHIPVLVFDEIDSGISGKTAQIVGRKINELARFHQLICVTHLPQIAAFADHHYKVSKTAHENATTVEISSLNLDEQISEIAHLLGGMNITEQALANASQLLKEAGRTK